MNENTTNPPIPAVVPSQASLASDVLVEYVTIAIGMIDRNGKQYETIHNIDENFLISKFKLEQDRKLKPCKNDNNDIVDYEPTGEYRLTLDVKFVTR